MSFFQSIKSALSSVSHSSITSFAADEEIQQVSNNNYHHHQPRTTILENNNTKDKSSEIAASSSIIITSDQHHQQETKLIETILFNQIPSEIIENHILPYLDERWLWKIGNRISKEWNLLISSIPCNLRMIFEEGTHINSFIESCKSGRFRSITSLTIGGNLLPQYLKDLVECEKLESLESLDIGFQIGNAGPIIIGNSKIPNLRKVNFNGNKIGCDGLRQLSKGSSCKNFKYLCLNDNWISVNGIMFLSNSNLCNLSYLDLSGNNMTAEALKFLSTGKLSLLVSLIMQRCQINNQGITHLVSGNLQNLTELDLQDNNIQTEGGKSIARGNLQQLIILNLGKNYISMEVASEIFTKLTTLKQFEWNEKKK